MSLNVDNNKIALAIPPVFRLAFRPLFLGGTLFAAIAIGWWVYFWLYPSAWLPHGGPIWWHGHEMLFGFGTAIVAGFLLTAVANWTDTRAIRGWPLFILAFTWLAGRILIAFNLGLPKWLIAGVDVTYLVFVTIAMAYPVIKVKQWQNLMFVPILSILAIINAISHWAVINNQYALALQCLHATVMVFTLLIAVLGGRVIPAFTANTTDCQRLIPIKWLEIISIISILLMLIIALIGLDQVPNMLLFAVASIAAIANALRFFRWGIHHSLSVPLLWSLHFSYAFIPLGFIMIALHSIDLLANTSAALHSFTVGSIGGMIISMISRVSLGHTGRPQQINAFIVLAFLSILVAALIRVILPAWFIEYYQVAIAVSGILWVLAFSIYLYFYAPMLVTTRVDGRPG
ncbi:MAG: NnrS family protein [Gammaproteobacteria bacterium]|nr:NnrS family protein [Gammaproteobacteria bacterium]